MLYIMETYHCTLSVLGTVQPMATHEGNRNTLFKLVRPHQTVLQWEKPAKPKKVHLPGDKDILIVSRWNDPQVHTAGKDTFTFFFLY